MEPMTVGKAAEVLGMSERHVRLLLKQGKLKGQHWGRDWMVVSLEGYQRRRCKPGEGKKRPLADWENGPPILRK